MKKVIIIGAGVAGMTSAMILAKAGYRVELFESKNVCGGRCFAVEDATTGDRIDNGQHVFVGAYREFFSLLQFLDTFDSAIFEKKFSYIFVDESQTYSLKSLVGHSPFGIALGIATYQAISPSERLSMLKFLSKLNKINLASDTSVLDLLSINGQSSRVIKYFWEPVVLAVMNQSVEKSSATLFLNVLKELFATPRNSLMVFSCSDLGSLFTNFQEKIESLGARIHFSNRIVNININNQHIESIEDKNGDLHKADYYISTLPPKSIAKLLEKSDSFLAVNTNFEHSPIVSCYIWTDQPLLQHKFIGTIGTHIHWVFDKREISQTKNSKYPYLYSITISNAGGIITDCYENISSIIEADLKRLNLLGSAKILHWRVFVDKTATISITPDNQSKRPSATTALSNFFIAGDWTATGLPATIEGAARSGRTASQMIINHESIQK